MLIKDRLSIEWFCNWLSLLDMRLPLEVIFADFEIVLQNDVYSLTLALLGFGIVICWRSNA